MMRLDFDLIIYLMQHLQLVLFFDPRVNFEAVFGTRVSLRSIEKYIEVSEKLVALTV